MWPILLDLLRFIGRRVSLSSLILHNNTFFISRTVGPTDVIYDNKTTAWKNTAVRWVSDGKMILPVRPRSLPSTHLSIYYSPNITLSFNPLPFRAPSSVIKTN